MLPDRAQIKQEISPKVMIAQLFIETSDKKNGDRGGIVETGCIARVSVVDGRAYYRVALLTLSEPVRWSTFRRPMQPVHKEVRFFRVDKWKVRKSAPPD